ncbi:hypothetical protein I350_00157 [Cryptococcus amylolentus CBS 6273]|uniref:Uncharacterized protein n=1 Tax=Cryptococcus amylolentus CBS 6273 TaxID=1296118 RepID=A0A1E3KE56_9TREE|nr:hypothetical protein I350_00157 [Cryptococcus amylolentus CBS 6273]
MPTSLAFSSVTTSSLIGVAIACGGNVLISLALTIQKLAHRRNEEALHASEYDSSDGDEGEEEDENGVQRTNPSRGPSPILEEDEPPPTPRPDGDVSFTPPSAGTFGARDLVMEQGTVVTEGFGGQALAEDLRDDGLVKMPIMIVPERSLSDSVTLQVPGNGQGDESALKSQSTSGSSSRVTSPTHKPILTKNHSNLRVKLESPPQHLRPKRMASERHVTDQEVEGQDGHEATSTQTSGQRLGKVQEGQYLKSRLWWAGMVLIAVGEGGNFLSYGFAPASVVAPLGTVALIANCVFAPLILGERFYKREIFGMALAIIGAVTVLDPDQLLHALTRTPFLIYTSLNLLLLLPLLFLSRLPIATRILPIDVAICALFGGYTVLATKALSSLLSQDFFGAWENGITWGCVAVVGGTSLGQVRWLNRALMRFQSKEVIPTQFVFFTLAAIIGSGVLYQEFEGLTFSSFVNFAFGIATTFFGVYLLTTTPSEPAFELSESGSETEEQVGDGEIQLNDPDDPELVRATSSSSLGFLLPPSSTTNEQAPLLVSSPSLYTSSTTASLAPGIPRRHSDAPILHSRGPGAGTGADGRSLTAIPATPRKARLTKRTSTGEFISAPKLVGSQAGVLLLATTPPPNSPAYLATSAGYVPHTGSLRGRGWTLGLGGGGRQGDEESGVEGTGYGSLGRARGRSRSGSVMFAEQRGESGSRQGSHSRSGSKASKRGDDQNQRA